MTRHKRQEYQNFNVPIPFAQKKYSISFDFNKINSKLTIYIQNVIPNWIPHGLIPCGSILFPRGHFLYLVSCNLISCLPTSDSSY